MQLGSLTLATIRKIIPWPPLSQVNTLKNNCPWQRRLVLLPVLLVIGLAKKTVAWTARKDKKSVIWSQAKRPERVLASLGMRQQAVIGNRVYLSGATTLLA
jgi:hypothetical protein